MKLNIYKIRFFLSVIVGLLSICAFWGIFYPIKIMNIQLIPAILSLFCNFSFVILILLITLSLLTLIFGRIYCSILCPLGIFQELFYFINKKTTSYKKISSLKYIITAITFGFLFSGSVVFVKYIDPYTIFGSTISLSIIGISTSILIATLVTFKQRVFCTSICPVGTLLGFLSKFSLFKIYIDKNECVNCGLCEKNCQSSCINSNEKIIDNENCIRCLKCLTICKKNAIKYNIVKKEKPINFSIKRRNLIIASATLLAFGGALKTGVELTKNYTKKFIDIILPAGAFNADRMQNKCLNCNLCIENCPNKILTKANEKFPVVHIDLNKGEGFCKYDCKKCSEVCPSGAIKNLSLEEKQKTRIAIAKVTNENCIHCRLCQYECPINAISYNEEGNTIIDDKKCIGCGKCKTGCYHNAINIFAINEQETI